MGVLFINIYTLLMIQYKGNDTFSMMDFPLPKVWIKKNIVNKAWWFVNPLLIAVTIAFIIYFLILWLVMPKIIRLVESDERKKEIYEEQIKLKEEDSTEDPNKNDVNNNNQKVNIQLDKMGCKKQPFDGAIKEEGSSYNDSDNEIEKLSFLNSNTQSQNLDAKPSSTDLPLKMHNFQTRQPISSTSDPNFDYDFNQKSSIPLISDQSNQKYDPTNPILQKVASVGQSVTHHGKFKINSISTSNNQNNNHHHHNHNSIAKKSSVISKAGMIVDLQAKTLNDVARKYHSKSLTNVDKIPDNYHSWSGKGSHKHELTQISNDINESRKNRIKSANCSETGINSLHPVNHNNRTGGFQKVLDNVRGKRTRHASESLAHTITNVTVHNSIPVGNRHSVRSNNSTINSDKCIPLTNNPQSYDSELQNIDEKHENYDTDATESRQGEPCQFKLGQEESLDIDGRVIAMSPVLDGEKKGVIFNEIVDMQPEVLEGQIDGIFVEDYFKRLQVVAACCSALAHGGNDTGNAIAPLIGIYLLHTYGPL